MAINTISRIADDINILLKSEGVRSFLLVITAVCAGYTLQPIPKRINQLFDNSPTFKYGILLVLLLIAMYPINQYTLVLSLIIPIFVLEGFALLRKYDDIQEKEKSLDHVV